MEASGTILFLSPRCRAGLCDQSRQPLLRGASLFLCPRFPAGFCDPGEAGKLPQLRCVSMLSVSGWTLRLPITSNWTRGKFSMPSVSGGTL